MVDRIVIGVDIGTTSTKSGAYRLDGSALVTAHAATELRRRGPGEVDQDPDALLESAYATIAECVARAGVGPEAVAALAVTGQMAGVLGIDQNWRPVTAYDSWLDSRCAPQLGKLAREHGDLLVQLTGCPPMLNHAPKMQWWRDERPDEYDRISAFVVAAVYVAGCMTGLAAPEAFVDPTYLHFTGAADASTSEWSLTLIEALGLDAAKLPRIVAADTVIGCLTEAAGRRCGLRAGVPVAAGLGDTAAGALGAGIVRTGQLLDTAGTAAVLLGAVDEFRADEDQGLLIMRGALPGQWLPLNYVAGGGLGLPWLADLTGIGECKQPAGLTRLLSDAAGVAVGADGLLFVPHFQGRTAPHQAYMRGAFVGLSFAHGRAHMARSILEAIAFEYAVYVRTMRRLQPTVEFSTVRTIGGGARSALWNSIKADVLGLPVVRVVAEETATRGAALIAAQAVGLIGDLGAVAGMVPTADAVQPDSARHECYGALLDGYAELVSMLAERSTVSPPSALERNLCS